jgi:hypothetical protein
MCLSPQKDAPGKPGLSLSPKLGPFRVLAGRMIRRHLYFEGALQASEHRGDLETPPRAEGWRQQITSLRFGAKDDPGYFPISFVQP